MFTQHQLISRKYCEAQKEMHANPKGYGGRGDHWAPTVIEIAKRYDAGSILDYGAGQGRLSKAVRAAGFDCRNYDPAVVGMDRMPSFADLVVCTDVMEHIELNRMDAVLAHIRLLARKAVFFVIATRPANKRLPNGGNAHLTIERDTWWRDRVVQAGFTVQPPPTVFPDKMPGKCWIGVVLP